MNNKIFLLLTFIALCSVDPIASDAGKESGPIPDAAAGIDYFVVDNVGFSQEDAAYAPSLAKKSRIAFPDLIQLDSQMKSLRKTFEAKYGGKWNCMAGFENLNGFSGWRGKRIIYLMSELEEQPQFIACSEGCNGTPCTQFTGQD